LNRLMESIFLESSARRTPLEVKATMAEVGWGRMGVVGGVTARKAIGVRGVGMVETLVSGFISDSGVLAL
jgi:hypothetical protein